MQKEKSLLEMLRGVNRRPKETMLFLVINFLRISINENRHKNNPLLHQEMIDYLSVAISKTFGDDGPLTQRWKIVEAVSFRLLGR